MVSRVVQSGIYAIRHIESGRRYVGSAKDIAKRFDGHRSMLGRRKHHAEVLQILWYAYGPDAFVFEIVELVDDVTDLLAREQFHMDAVLAEGRSVLLNGCLIAGSSRGREETAESNAKRSAALKGRPKSPEHAAKVGARHKGKIVSEETRAKLRVHNLGKTLSEETRAKLSAQGRGRPKSAEWRAKVSAANIGKRHTQESNDKNAAWHTGRSQSADTISKRKATMAERKRMRTVHEAVHALYQVN